jgi:hypothetical protein
MKFAERFPTDEELGHAVTQFGSWHVIVNEAPPEHREWETPDDFPPMPRTVTSATHPAGIASTPAGPTHGGEALDGARALDPAGPARPPGRAIPSEPRTHSGCPLRTRNAEGTPGHPPDRNRCDGSRVQSTRRARDARLSRAGESDRLAILGNA